MGCDSLIDIQSKLDVEHWVRSNPLPWKGQFTPQLVEYLLQTHSVSGGRVLDPFVGSGTVIYNCLLQGHPSVGVDVNPAAVILSKVYTLSSLSEADREAAIERVGSAQAFDTDTPDAVISNALCCLVETANSPRVRDARKASLTALIRSLPTNSELAPVVLLGDARRIPVESGSVDLVLTSPPYINVINYHQQYRPSVESLGWDVLKSARSEIGSNRKFRGNRFNTVTQYILDMALVLSDLCRLIKRDGKAVFVVGRQSQVRKTPFYNADILERMALALDIEVGSKQTRTFTNKYGQRIVEDILVFKLRSAALDSQEVLDFARHLATAVLIEARDRVSDLSIAADLESAIENVPDVNISDLQA